MSVTSPRRHVVGRFSMLSALCAAGLFSVVGCGSGGGYQDVTDEDVRHAEEHVDEHHHHHHEAPHGGHLIELGEHQYNAEVVLDDSGQLVVYVLDAHAENAVAIAQEQIEFAVEGGSPIVLTAEAQEGDPEGKSSRFVAAGDAVNVDDAEELHGSLTVEIDGNSFTGELAHDHEGHDHDHEGHDHSGPDEHGHE